MERRIIVENERVSNVKDFASNDNIETNTVAQEIVRSVDYRNARRKILSL